jgi:Holliday junction DNA helicase RuvA
MIGRLQGLLEDHWQDGGRCGVVIDCAGVGYEVQVPRGWHERLRLQAPPLHLLVHIHHVIREDASLLFGFERKDERELFRLLLGVSGVGPQVAMALASTLEHGQLIAAIAAGDLVRLGKAPGVGRRTAERIVVDLRDKLPQEAAGGREPGPRHHEAEGEVERTLAALGYRDDEIQRSLGRCRGQDGAADDPDVDDLLRRCLAWLAREGS